MCKEPVCSFSTNTLLHTVAHLEAAQCKRSYLLATEQHHWNSLELWVINAILHLRIENTSIHIMKMLIMDSTNQIRLLPGHGLNKYIYSPGLGKTITHWTVLMQLVIAWLLCCSPCQTHKVGNSNMADCAAYLIGQAVVPNLITWMGNLHVWLPLERKKKHGNNSMRHLFITIKNLQKKYFFLYAEKSAFTV